MIQEKKISQIVLILTLLLLSIYANSQNIKQVESKKSKYFVLFEMPVGIGVGAVSVAGQEIQNNDYSIGFRMVTGIHDHKTIFFGVGLGIDKYQDVALLPLTFDLRIPFSKKVVTPMLILNAGYSVGIGNVIGGAIIDPALAIKMDIPNTDASAFFSIGYKWQQNEFDYTYRNIRNTKIYPIYTADVFWQFFTINFGFYF